MIKYLKRNPVARIECSSHFSNYVAFVYENGLIPATKRIIHRDGWIDKLDAKNEDRGIGVKEVKKFVKK